MDPSPEDLKTHRIARHVRAYYERLFGGDSAPSSRLPILRGRDLGAALGYPLELLRDLPDTAWSHFLPCGNPLPLLKPRPGDRILNLGAGIGIDSLALVRACDSPVHVVNLDVILGVLLHQKDIVSRLGPRDLNTRHELISSVCAEGDRLPFRSESFDWIVMNGVLNVFPDKERLLGEAHRALTRNGRLVVLDLCASEDLPEYFGEELDGWAWCMSGACNRPRLTSLVEASGLRLERFSETEPADLIFRMELVAQKPGAGF